MLEFSAFGPHPQTMIPILVLILGAIGLLAGLQPRFRFVGVLGAVTAFFALLALALMGFRLPETNIVSNWSPTALFPQPLTFRIDALAWLMGLALMTATLAVFLTGLARGGGRRLAPRVMTLLIAAAALAAIFAADLVTLAIAWAGLDLLYFLALVALAEGDERQAVLSLAFNTAATLFVVAAAVNVMAAGEKPIFGAMPFGPRATLLLALAAAFRLGLFPLHLGLPVEANVRQGLGTILRLAPAATALVLVGRILSVEGTLPLRPWLTVAGVAALWVGASQWWLAQDARQGLTFFVLAQSGLALVTGLWGGEAALVGLTAQSLALVLGGAVVFLFNGHDDQAPWFTALPGAAGAALIGVPFLTGFTGQWALYTGLIAQGNFVVLIVCAVAQIILVAGFLRLCFWQADAPLPPGEPLVTAAYFIGLALPILVLLFAGLSPSGLADFLGSGGVPSLAGLFNLRGLIGLAVIGLAAINGAALWRFEADLRARTDTVWNALTVVTRLDWLYLAVWEIYRAISRVLRMAAEILEGQGAVLWAVLVAFVIWLTISGRAR